MIEWQSDVSDPSEFMANLKVDLDQDEVVAFTPKGEVVHLPAGATPGRLRLRHPHPDRPQVHRRQGRRLPRRAVDAAALGPDRRDLHGQDRRTPAPRPTGSSGSPRPRPPRRSASGWRSSGATRVLEVGQEELEKELRVRGLPAGRGHGVGGRAAGRGRAELRRPRRRCTGPSASATSPPRAVAARVRRVLAEGAPEAETRLTSSVLEPRRPARAPQHRPACTSRAWTTSSSAWPAAARRCRPTRSWASTPGAGASPSTGPTAPTPCRSPPPSQGRLVEVEWDSDGAGNYLVSVEVRALDRTKLLRDVAVGAVRPPHQHRRLPDADRRRPGLQDALRLRGQRPVPPRRRHGDDPVASRASTAPRRVMPPAADRDSERRRRRPARRGRRRRRRRPDAPRPTLIRVGRPDGRTLEACSATRRRGELTTSTTSASATSRWVAAAQVLELPDAPLPARRSPR